MSSQNNKKATIGLFGFGVVGEGVFQVLKNTPSLNATIKRICILHPEKERSAPATLFTSDPDSLLQDEEINVIVELTNDPVAALRIVRAAFKNNKAVVSANKKMIADNLPELLSLQQQYRVPFLYEAAACASIPVIRNLEEYYDNDLLRSISGIINGSTNYILTKVFEDQLDFESALLDAQIHGFAESDPGLDTSGADAANKLSILLAHAYGLVAAPGEFVYSGIEQLRTEDAVYAKEKGYQIRLVAQARKLDHADSASSGDRIVAFVLPQFVRKDTQLCQVRHEYNGLVIESSLADRQFFYGKGAGSFPTASAVLSDLSALRYGYRYEYRKLSRNRGAILSNDCYLRVYVSFEKLFQVPREAFEQILEWSSTESRCHVTGIVHYETLQKSNWWRRQGTSLILLPEPFTEDYESTEVAAGYGALLVPA